MVAFQRTGVDFWAYRPGMVDEASPARKAAAGWYPHASQPGMSRFWDGQQWTDQVRSAAPPPLPPPAPSTGAKVMTWAKAHPRAAAAVVVVVLIVVVGGAFSGGDDGADDQADDGGGTAATSSDEPKPDNAKPEKPKKPIELLQDAVDDADDVDDPEVTLDRDQIATVEFNVRDNLSDNLIRTGIGVDVFAMLEQIDDSGVEVKEVAFRGLFPLIDKYGNEEDGQVFFTTFRGRDIAKIDYDNIVATSFDNIENLAIQGIVVLHPDLQE